MSTKTDKIADASIVKIAIVSDIHANLEAWLSVKKDIQAQDCNFTFCLGDVVGYGPNPKECFEDVLNFCDVVIRGNHEEAVINSHEEAGLNWLARAGVQFSREQLSENQKALIEELPFTKEVPLFNIVLCHGAYTEPFMYLLGSGDAEEELPHLPQKLCFVGHSHNPFIFAQKGRMLQKLSEPLQIDKHQKYIFNVGSVGQPRDYDHRACYGLLTLRMQDKLLQEATYQLKRVAYDIEAVAKKIKAAGLPERLAERLFKGV